MRKLLSMAVLAAACALSPVAYGDDDAAALFGEANERFDARDYAAALPLFQRALRASGSPNARLYVARCLLELGQVSEAYDQMKQTVAEATKRAESETKYVPTRDSAASELAILEQRVGKIVIAIADPPEDLEVRIDDGVIAREKIGKAIAVEPGTLTVVVTAAGKAPKTLKVAVAAGQLETVAISLKDASAAPADPGSAPPDPVDEPDTSSGGGVRIGGFVVAGLGVAGVAVFVGLAVKAKSDFDELDAECSGQPCPPTHADRVAAGRRLQTAANASLVAGGVLVAAGTAMVIFGGPAENDAASAALVPLPGGGFLSVAGRF